MTIERTRRSPAARAIFSSSATDESFIPSTEVESESLPGAANPALAYLLVPHREGLNYGTATLGPMIHEDVRLYIYIYVYICMFARKLAI